MREPRSPRLRTQRSKRKFSLRTILTVCASIIISVQFYLVTKYAKIVSTNSLENDRFDKMRAFDSPKSVEPVPVPVPEPDPEPEPEQDSQPLPVIPTYPEPVKAEESPASELPKATIAYAVSLTSCNAGFTADGAAVLKHSIHLSSYPNKNSKYAYKMILFAHPGALECVKPFEKLGYEVQMREVPINAAEIKGDFYREHVVKSGCCGDKEFLKLYAYTLVDYPIVVHLDLDSLILQPFDDLFDAMLDGGSSASGSALPIMHNNVVPESIEAFYTKDYNMINPGHQHPGVQGGFLVIKPNMNHFEEYKKVILEGNFRQGGGWAGKWGGYFGAQQIQGICSYFFEGLHPGTAVELNRCIYNSMNDAPKGSKRGKNVVPGTMACRDGKETCEDCRETDIEKIKSVHFTLCQKPWICPLLAIRKSPLCEEFHKRWFSIRKDWEEQRSDPVEDVGAVDFHNDVFHGFCKGQGDSNYRHITL